MDCIQEMSGDVVPDGKCSTPKPSTSSACVEAACQVLFGSGLVGPWGPVVRGPTVNPLKSGQFGPICPEPFCLP